MTCLYPDCEPGRFGTICKPECTPVDKTTVPVHSDGCWSWGPRHYLCALDEIRRLKSELESNQ